MLRNDRGVRYYGLLKTLARGGAAIIQYYGTDDGGDWRMYSKPKYVTVTGAEVLDDA